MPVEQCTYAGALGSARCYASAEQHLVEGYTVDFASRKLFVSRMLVEEQ